MPAYDRQPPDMTVAPAPAGSRRHRVMPSNRSGSELGGRSYLMTPKSAPQSWVSITVPTIGPKPLEKPVRFRVCGSGPGLPDAQPFLWYVGTNPSPYFP